MTVSEIMKPKRIITFDVEATGLEDENGVPGGVGFAYGLAVWTEKDGIIYEELVSAGVKNLNPCKWVLENTPSEILNPEIERYNGIRRCYGVQSIEKLRKCFSTSFNYHRRNATAIVDCGYPVEAKFLIDCGLSVFPLHELATLQLKAGLEPGGTYDRKPDELPAHNPLCDARQTLRLALELI